MLRLQLNKKITSMAVAAIAFASISCRGQEVQHRAAGRPQASGPTAGRQAPFDVEAVIRQVHFAYRPEQDGWRGGHSTYDVKATAQGLTLTPVRSQGSEPEALEPSEAPAGAPLPPTRERGAGGSALPGHGAGGARGHRAERGGPSRARWRRMGTWRFQHGAFVEHLRNSEQGVEQSWSFERRPAAQGELRVTIPVKGLVHTRHHRAGPALRGRPARGSGSGTATAPGWMGRGGARPSAPSTSTARSSCVSPSRCSPRPRTRRCSIPWSATR